MIYRVRRPYQVGIDGTLSPAPDSRLRIEQAAGERTLYRDLATMARRDVRVARAASTWGLLARSSATLDVASKQLGAYMSARREEWHTAALASAGDSGDARDGPLDALAPVMSNLFDMLSDQVGGEFGFSADDLAAFVQAIPDESVESIDQLVSSAMTALEAARGRYAANGSSVPRWVREFDAADDLGQSFTALLTASEDLARAATPQETADAVRAIRALLANPSPRSVDDDQLNEALEPLFAQLDQTRGRDALRARPSRSDDQVWRAAVPVLINYWRAADTPGVEPPDGVSMPGLAEPDTWRTVHNLAAAVGKLGFQRELAREWREFSIECALWRDAIDALSTAQLSDDTYAPERLRYALRALGSQIGPALGLPEGDLTGFAGAASASIRERLLWWLDARCAIAGLDPRPRTGIVGTEGRALLSIHHALQNDEPRRTCARPGCQEPLPPESYRHKRLCALHLRENAAARAAAYRRAKRDRAPDPRSG
ncbi:MAG: hypothetical protein ACLQHS_00755 [Candidatus Limnocylindrales bacterium]